MEARCRQGNGERIRESTSFKTKRTKNSTPDRLRHGSTRHSSVSINPRNVLKRTGSEPILYNVGVSLQREDEIHLHNHPKINNELKNSMMNPRTFSDLSDRSARTPLLNFGQDGSPSAPRLSFPFSSKLNAKSGQKALVEEHRILVNVTVEGSTGSIRMLVRKGDTVTDLIKLTIDNYAREGRQPLLDSDTNMFELHDSQFSMESLNRSDRVGEFGTRTFFLRQENHGVAQEPALFTATPGFLFSSIIVKPIKKIGKKTKKLWKMMES